MSRASSPLCLSAHHQPTRPSLQLDWMQNPVGVDQAGEAFSCDLPTPHPASATCDTVTVCQYDNEYMQVCGPDCPEQPVHVAPSRWKELLCDLGPDSCFLGKKTGPCCSAAGFGATPVA